MKRILSFSILLATLNGSLLTSYSIAKDKTSYDEVADPNNDIAKTQNGETNATVAEYGLCHECTKNNFHGKLTDSSAARTPVVGAEAKQNPTDAKSGSNGGTR